MFISIDVCFAGHKGSAWTHRNRNSSVFVLRSQINCVFVWDKTSAKERAGKVLSVARWSEIHQIAESQESLNNRTASIHSSV